MRNVIGQHVEGENFFSRNNILEQIYRRVENTHLFMSAPRRVGKTSIMCHLRDNPKDGFFFILVNTEEINNKEDFYKRLLTEIFDSPVVKDIAKANQKAKSLFEYIGENLKKIGVFGFEVELANQRPKDAYFEQFCDLVSRLDESSVQIVLMIDEFPSTIENIRNDQGEREAINFLQQNRVIRQSASNAIRFIYTGSIGLPNLVNRLGYPETINDLNVVEVPPLSVDEGKNLAAALLKGHAVPFEDNILDYLMEKIAWLMPFYIQLSVQELIEVFDEFDSPIDIKMVDKAFSKMYNRRNNVHFVSYYKRLAKAFVTQEEHEMAERILAYLSENDSVSKSFFFPDLKKEEDKRMARYIFETLEYDGYLFYNEEDKTYRFSSPILRNWWKNNMH